MGAQRLPRVLTMYTPGLTGTFIKKMTAATGRSGTMADGSRSTTIRALFPHKINRMGDRTPPGGRRTREHWEPAISLLPMASRTPEIVKDRGRPISRQRPRLTRARARQAGDQRASPPEPSGRIRLARKGKDRTT